MIRGAIFDIDGTVLDSMPIWSDAGARYLAGCGITAEPGLGEILFRMTLEEGSLYLKEAYSLEASQDEIIRGILGVTEQFYREEVRLKPGIRALLEDYRTRGIPMVIATTNDRALVQATLTRLGVWDYFCGFFNAVELHTTKFQPDLYLIAADYLGTAPEETVVYEDVIHAIRSAKGAGFYTVGVFDDASLADREEICRICDEILDPQAQPSDCGG